MTGCAPEFGGYRRLRGVVVGGTMAAKYTHLTAKKRDAFLDLLREGHTVRHACQALNISRSRPYQLRSEDPLFAAAWEEAEAEGAESLEQEAFRRAVLGVNKPVFQQGHEVGTIREYSDTLLIFLLKGRLPNKYKDRAQHELTGANGADLTFTINIDRRDDDSDNE